MGIRLRIILLLIVPTLGFCPIAHGDEPLSPSVVVDIGTRVGWQLKNAGFDMAQHILAIDDASDEYVTESDTVKLGSIREELTSPDLQRRYDRISTVDRLRVIAAHEQCHAFLIKHRHKLPTAVQDAREACRIFPEGRGGRLFDEEFCDMTAVNVIGNPAKEYFTVLRREEGGGSRTKIEDYFRHSYPVFLLALAANDVRIRNPVTRTALAMRSACRSPAVQKWAGAMEHRYGQQLTQEMAAYLPVTVGEPEPVDIPPLAKWRQSKSKDKAYRYLSEDFGDSPIMGFTQTYAACRHYLSHHSLPDSPYSTRAMERCKLTKDAFDSAYCAVVTRYVTPMVMSAQSDTKESLYAQIAAYQFGPDTLPVRLMEEERDLNISIFATTDRKNPRDISLAIEHACGAEAEELSEQLSQYGLEKR